MPSKARYRELNGQERRWRLLQADLSGSFTWQEHPGADHRRDFHSFG